LEGFDRLPEKYHAAGCADIRKELYEKVEKDPYMLKMLQGRSGNEKNYLIAEYLGRKHKVDSLELDDLKKKLYEAHKKAITLLKISKKQEDLAKNILYGRVSLIDLFKNNELSDGPLNIFVTLRVSNLKLFKDDEPIYLQNYIEEDKDTYCTSKSLSSTSQTTFIKEEELAGFIEKWEKIDPDHKFEDVYNRYAHMNVNLSANESSKFEHVPGRKDIISVTFNVNDLEKLNVTYIESEQDLSKYSNENVDFEKIYSYRNLKIYKVNY
jgi:hypothetical protein